VALLRWERLRQAAVREPAGDQWEETGYVFTTRTGRPIEPQPVPLIHPRRRAPRDSAARCPVRLRDSADRCRSPAPRRDEILGHSQIAVTMNIYAHVVQDTQREAVSHLDRMLKRQRPDRG
jgi:integrase